VFDASYFFIGLSPSDTHRNRLMNSPALNRQTAKTLASKVSTLTPMHDLQITPLWSSYYAMAVIELGQEIKAARQR